MEGHHHGRRKVTETSALWVLLLKRKVITPELRYIEINTSPNTRTVQLAKTRAITFDLRESLPRPPIELKRCETSRENRQLVLVLALVLSLAMYHHINIIDIYVRLLYLHINHTAKLCHDGHTYFVRGRDKMRQHENEETHAHCQNTPGTEHWLLS